METSPRFTNERRVAEISSGTVLLGRVMWMMLGPVALFFITLAIITKGGGWFGAEDALYGVIVALMIGGRWIEQRSGAARTATGEPATVEHFKRYARVLVPASVAMWVVANALGNHVLT